MDTYVTLTLEVGPAAGPRCDFILSGSAVFAASSIVEALAHQGINVTMSDVLVQRISSLTAGGFRVTYVIILPEGGTVGDMDQYVPCGVPRSPPSHTPLQHIRAHMPPPLPSCCPRIPDHLGDPISGLPPSHPHIRTPTHIAT
jgi:hypothetical protein